MATENPLRDELLRQAEQNGTVVKGDVDRTVRDILARDEARVRRMKKLTNLAWAAFGLSILAFIGAKMISDSRMVEPVGIIGIQAVLLVAVSFTISLYVRSRTLTMHQIQSRLSQIEDLLKQVVQETRK